MDAAVNSAVLANNSGETDKIENENLDQESSPSSTSKQEVNKQVELPNEDLSKDDQVPVVHKDTNEGDKSVIANGCSESENKKIGKKGKRNVFFPVDSTIVKGYLEPPDPWKDGV